MPGMIQIRNVPDALHRKLKARAALAGQTLSDYLLREVERVAAGAPAQPNASHPSIDPAALVREEHDRR